MTKVKLMKVVETGMTHTHTARTKNRKRKRTNKQLNRIKIKLSVAKPLPKQLCSHFIAVTVTAVPFALSILKSSIIILVVACIRAYFILSEQRLFFLYEQNDSLKMKLEKLKWKENYYDKTEFIESNQVM